MFDEFPLILTTKKPGNKSRKKKSAKLQIRSPKHWPIGFFAGLSYINMVAAWGGVLVRMDLLWPGWLNGSS